MAIKISNKKSSFEKLQPREKLEKFGLDALDDSELLSLIFGTGYWGLSVSELSKHLLAEFGTKGLFQFESLENFRNETGLPPVKSFQILAISEIYRRIKQKDLVQIKSSQQLYDYLKDDFKKSVFEKLVVVCTDSQRRILYSGLLAQGESNKLSVSLASIFHHQIRLNCKNFYLAHNHPNWVSKPSKEDLEFTLAVKEESLKFGLSFDDHLIFGEDGFFSFSLNWVL